MAVLAWLFPTLGAFFNYGIGQGLVKKYAGDVAPAQFCLFLVLAKSISNGAYFLAVGETIPESWTLFTSIGTLAYLLDGLAWVLYFESVVWGPITIVGTLSAAYPTFTVLFAWIFLGESLGLPQILGVLLLVTGCVGLSYAPAEKGGSRGRRWIALATGALILWGVAQTLVKYAYSLPGASDARLALLNTLGGALTLGLYGVYRRREISVAGSFWRSFAPMALMASGDLLVLIASRTGPVSIVTPLSGAYPVVTLGFAMVFLKERLNLLQWICAGLVLGGMVLAV